MSLPQTQQDLSSPALPDGARVMITVPPLNGGAA